LLLLRAFSFYSPDNDLSGEKQKSGVHIKTAPAQTHAQTHTHTHTKIQEAGGRQCDSRVASYHVLAFQERSKRFSQGKNKKKSRANY
jgi:hypothetical protein